MRVRGVSVVAALATLLGAFLSLAPTAQSASYAWAPAASAAIHPGVVLVTDGASCTSNFVFTDGSGGVYLGMAAHCAGTGTNTDTNGCTTPSLPLGTPVQVEGATRPATLFYSSWYAMQQRHETNPVLCDFNDFALVKLDPADRSRVNPSIPHWGGPVGIDTAGPGWLGTVHSYGNSPLRQGITALSPKSGSNLETLDGGWSHRVVTVTPGIPGDSGSAFLDAQGNALGVLSTLVLTPVPGSNQVSDLSHVLTYYLWTQPVPVSLALGTQPFRGNQLPLGG